MFKKKRGRPSNAYKRKIRNIKILGITSIIGMFGILLYGVSNYSEKLNASVISTTEGFNIKEIDLDGVENKTLSMDLCGMTYLKFYSINNDMPDEIKGSNKDKFSIYISKWNAMSLRQSKDLTKNEIFEFIYSYSENGNKTFKIKNTKTCKAPKVYASVCDEEIRSSEETSSCLNYNNYLSQLTLNGIEKMTIGKTYDFYSYGNKYTAEGSIHINSILSATDDVEEISNTDLIYNLNNYTFKSSNEKVIKYDAKSSKLIPQGVGIATVTIKDKKNNDTGKIIVKVINKMIYRNHIIDQEIYDKKDGQKVENSLPEQSYTGSQIKPKVYIEKSPYETESEKELKEGKDYKLSYGKNISNRGTVTITGINNYKGKITIPFKIVKNGKTPTKQTPTKNTPTKQATFKIEDENSNNITNKTIMKDTCGVTYLYLNGISGYESESVSTTNKYIKSVTSQNDNYYVNYMSNYVILRQKKNLKVNEKDKIIVKSGDDSEAYVVLKNKNTCNVPDLTISGQKIYYYGIPNNITIGVNDFLQGIKVRTSINDKVDNINNYIITSSNEDVVYYNPYDNYITAIGKGTAIVTIKTPDGKKQGKINITVTNNDTMKLQNQSRDFLNGECGKDITFEVVDTSKKGNISDLYYFDDNHLDSNNNKVAQYFTRNNMVTLSPNKVKIILSKSHTNFDLYSKNIYGVTTKLFGSGKSINVCVSSNKVEDKSDTNTMKLQNQNRSLTSGTCSNKPLTFEITDTKKNKITSIEYSETGNSNDYHKLNINCNKEGNICKVTIKKSHVRIYFKATNSKGKTQIFGIGSKYSVCVTNEANETYFKGVGNNKKIKSLTMGKDEHVYLNVAYAKTSKSSGIKCSSSNEKVSRVTDCDNPIIITAYSIGKSKIVLRDVNGTNSTASLELNVTNNPTMKITNDKQLKSGKCTKKSLTFNIVDNTKTKMYNVWYSTDNENWNSLGSGNVSIKNNVATVTLRKSYNKIYFMGENELGVHKKLGQFKINCK